MNGASQPVVVLDAMCLNHFARVDRLDVLRDLLIGDECRTTYVVLNELREGVSTHPDLQAALELEWVRPVRLESVPELECFAKWVDRIGAGDGIWARPAFSPWRSCAAERRSRTIAPPRG